MASIDSGGEGALQKGLKESDNKRRKLEYKKYMEMGKTKWRCRSKDKNIKLEASIK